MPRSATTGFLLGFATALATVALIGVAIAYSGAYDIAASGGHTAGMRWLLDTGMHASVRARAGDGTRPGTTEADVGAGAGEYKAMCEHCHGAPGVEPQAWSRGMLPQPPDLVEVAEEWNADEITWIVQHGLKYTGMPAFGEDHDPATLRDITAFVQRLPGMTPAQYAAFEAGRGHGSHSHGVEPPAAATGAGGTPPADGSTPTALGTGDEDDETREEGDGQDRHDHDDHDHRAH